MYDLILVPTDGSDAAAAAIEPAVDLATRYDATLHALYAVDVEAFAVSDVDTSVIVAGFEREGDRAVAAVADAAAAVGVPCETFVTHGKPADTVLDHAVTHDVDCLVMSTHGRQGLSRLLLGSTTERVLRLTERPVLVVQGGAE